MVRVRLLSLGKEATLGILSDKDFVGEDCLAGQPLRIASAFDAGGLLKVHK
jgi:CRP-like cAMP-binding protein